MTRAVGVRLHEWVSTGSSRPTLSVIVPVLDEERRLGALLRELAVAPAIDEIVVVDGGSHDRTVAIARSQPGVIVATAARGRGNQMNVGARLAESDVLLFLHADTQLPSDAARWITETLADPDVVAGAFRTWTVADEGWAPWFAPLLHLADLRSRYSGLPYGDQALFVRARVFRQLGGFSTQLLMEDLEFCQRVRRVGRIRTVRARVRVSGRRFLERPAYYTFVVNVFPLLYRLRIPTAVLARFYGNTR